MVLKEGVTLPLQSLLNLCDIEVPVRNLLSHIEKAIIL